MYQPQSLLEAYYSIYQPRPSLDEETYNIVINYLLENFEFVDEDHLYEMIGLLDQNMIDEILSETAEKGHPDIKGQPEFQKRVEAEMARRRAAREGKKPEVEDKKSEEKQKSSSNISFEIGKGKKTKKTNIQWKKPSL